MTLSCEGQNLVPEPSYETEEDDRTGQTRTWADGEREADDEHQIVGCTKQITLGNRLNNEMLSLENLIDAQYSTRVQIWKLVRIRFCNLFFHCFYMVCNDNLILDRIRQGRTGQDGTNKNRSRWRERSRRSMNIKWLAVQNKLHTETDWIMTLFQSAKTCLIDTVFSGPAVSLLNTMRRHSILSIISPPVTCL